MKEHGVDYCGDCSDFPCDKVESILSLYRSRLDWDEFIKQPGIEEFFKEKKQYPTIQSSYINRAIHFYLFNAGGVF